MITLTDSQVLKIEARLRRIETNTRGDRKTANDVRVALLEISKARRRETRRKEAEGLFKKGNNK